MLQAEVERVCLCRLVLTVDVQFGAACMLVSQHRSTGAWLVQLSMQALGHFTGGMLHATSEVSTCCTATQEWFRKWGASHDFVVS